jgi:hypothetical protein
MSLTKPETLIQWMPSDTTVIPPEKIATGWVVEKPAWQYFNALFKNQGLWAKFIDDFIPILSEGVMHITGGRTLNIGTDAGTLSGAGTLGTDTTNLGYRAGRDAVENTNGVNVGVNAGLRASGESSINLGNLAGQDSVNPFGVSIGLSANTRRTGNNNLSLGQQSGLCSGSPISTNDTINLGREAGLDNAGSYSVNIGPESGRGQTGGDQINIGRQSGIAPAGTVNNADAISLGYRAGYLANSTSSINIGASSGQSQTGIFNINLGASAGRDSTGSTNINLGEQAGSHLAGSNCISLGYQALQCTVDADVGDVSKSIALGFGTAKFNSGSMASGLREFIAIGPSMDMTGPYTAAVQHPIKIGLGVGTTRPIISGFMSKTSWKQQLLQSNAGLRVANMTSSEILDWITHFTVADVQGTIFFDTTINKLVCVIDSSTVIALW